MLIKILNLITLFIFVSCSSTKVDKLKSYFNEPDRSKEFFKLSWNRNMDPPYTTGNLPIGWITPLIYENFIITGDLEGNLNFFSKDQGRVVTKIVEDGPIQGKPLVVNNMVVYGTSEGSLIARNIKTQNLIFKKNLNSSIESEAIYYKNRIIVHLRNHTVATLDAKTGKILWSYKRAVPFLTTLNRVSIPTPYKNNILVGFADGYLASISISDGSIEWEKKIATGKKFIDVDLRPVVINGKVWIGSLGSDVFVINPDNGVTLRRLVHQIAVAPFEYKGEVILMTDSGEIVKCDKQGAINSKLKLRKMGFSSATIWKNRVVASTFDGQLLALNDDLNSVIDDFKFGHSYSSLFGFIEAGEKTLAAYTSRNRLYIFR